ncbi:hypothetical protein PTNB73_00914 [Pyrenophora teres f. teres]|nr:hypothetical protein PTNB73_00914 [Pyrenophora teres f. teres]
MDHPPPTPPPPPPPPPLPPPRKLSKVSSQGISIPPPPPPPQVAHEPIAKIVYMRSLIAESAQTSEKSFEPCHMFFYGSLMDPEVIQSVIKLTELPTTKPATISGFKIKMWGIYPALVPSGHTHNFEFFRTRETPSETNYIYQKK